MTLEVGISRLIDGVRSFHHTKLRFGVARVGGNSVVYVLPTRHVSLRYGIGHGMPEIQPLAGGRAGDQSLKRMTKARGAEVRAKSRRKSKQNHRALGARSPGQTGQTDPALQVGSKPETTVGIMIPVI